MDINFDSTNKVNKRPQKVIDAVNYNGKYMDPSIVKKRVLSATALLTTLALVSIAIMFLF